MWSLIRACSWLVFPVSGNPSFLAETPVLDVLHRWTEKSDFIWLITEDILDEYKEVLKRLRVRSNLIGRVINLIREQAEEVKVRGAGEISPDPKDDPFCLCSEQGKADFIVTLNPNDFPQDRLQALVLLPKFADGASFERDWRKVKKTGVE